MAAFYVDTDVSTRLANDLFRLGHPAIHGRSHLSPRASDAEHLLAAVQGSMTLVTHNGEDFRLLHDAWAIWLPALGIARTHPGILILPQVKGLDYAQIVDAFAASHSLPLASEVHEYRVNRGWTRVV